MAHLCLSFGLISFAARWTVPLLVGAVAACASGAAWNLAAGGTAAGLAVAAVAARPWFLPEAAQESAGFLIAAALFVLTGAAAAGGLAYALGRATNRGRSEWVAALALVAAIVACLWVTTGMVNSGALFPSGTETLNQVLSTRPQLADTPEDHDLYLRLFYDVHDGQPYYSSVARVWQADPGTGYRLPFGVSSYRLPTIFYLWLLLPADGAVLPWAFLVFATVAIGAAFSIGCQLGRPGVAVLGALLIATAFALLSTTTWVTFVDGWAMAVALGGIAIYVASVRRGSRSLLWGAVAALFAASALRELLVYLMVLAAAGVVLLPRHKRWREAWPWLVGLAAFVAFYAAHVAAISGRVDPQTGYGFWLQGGFDHLTATIEFLAEYFGGKPWLVPLLVLTGIAGAIGVRHVETRLAAVLTASIVAPLVAFLVFGNGGEELATGAPSGYWGVLVVPLALAMVPVAVNRALIAWGVRESGPAV